MWAIMGILVFASGTWSAEIRNQLLFQQPEESLPLAPSPSLKTRRPTVRYTQGVVKGLIKGRGVEDAHIQPSLEVAVPDSLGKVTQLSAIGVEQDEPYPPQPQQQYASSPYGSAPELESEVPPDGEEEEIQIPVTRNRPQKLYLASAAGPSSLNSLESPGGLKLGSPLRGLTRSRGPPKAVYRSPLPSSLGLETADDEGYSPMLLGRLRGRPSPSILSSSPVSYSSSPYGSGIEDNEGAIVSGPPPQFIGSPPPPAHVMFSSRPVRGGSGGLGSLFSFGRSSRRPSASPLSALTSFFGGNEGGSLISLGGRPSISSSPSYFGSGPVSTRYAAAGPPASSISSSSSGDPYNSYNSVYEDEGPVAQSYGL